MAVTDAPLALARVNDMTCYKELPSMSIQGKSLHSVNHTMGRAGKCHQPQFKLLGKGLSLLTLSSAECSLSIQL